MASTQPEVLEERVISDVETLRALSDPLRLRILEVLTGAIDEAFTVKRIAVAVGSSPTRLYHHINLLVERGLVVPAGQRVVSGIIETSYRAGQRRLRLDRALLAADAPAMHDTLVTIFDGARDDIERSLRAGVASTASDAPPERKLLLARGLARLGPEQVAGIHARLTALFEEFGLEPGDAPASTPGDDRPGYGLVIGLYPMVEPTDGDRPADGDPA